MPAISQFTFFEKQADFVIQTMSHLDKNGFHSIEVNTQIEDVFRNEINKQSESLTFTSVKDSWYISSSGCNTATHSWFRSFQNYTF